jgi:hypothetical protein
MNELLDLKGLNGSNPLGFLAALGVTIAMRILYPSAGLCWSSNQGIWQAQIWYCGDDENRFVEELHGVLTSASTTAFEINRKLPFETSSFASALQRAQSETSQDNRRTADLLASFGSEIVAEKGIFESSAFRMVRSGDSSGQGLPAYALTIRNTTSEDDLYRSLFHPWDYLDTGVSLRWDPLEDQRYALRWRDPKKCATQSMRGANTLALEALTLIPAFPRNSRLETTGFYRKTQRREFFTWPIWTEPLTPDTIRSLLALSELHQESPPRNTLEARGIVEMYRSERVSPNQYYKNFTPARPV